MTTSYPNWISNSWKFSSNCFSKRESYKNFSLRFKASMGTNLSNCEDFLPKKYRYAAKNQTIFHNENREI